MSLETEIRILKALETYQWQPDAVIYHFAEHLGYSESHVRRAIGDLIANGEIERVQEGSYRGKPRYIYQLRQEK